MQQAIADASLREKDISNQDTGLYTASAGSSRFLHSNLERMYKKGVMRCNPLSIVASIAGTLSFNLVSNFKIQGSSSGFASACASSGHAIGFAFDEVRMDRQKRMFVVGAEDCNFDSIVPFCGMRALTLSDDPDTAARPFASDGFNVAVSHPDGRGLRTAMQNSLQYSALNPRQICYVNAHAPSTSIGDLPEVHAMKEVFLPDASPMISSTKALTGHGLSLSSILESAISILCLKHGFVPGSAHIQELMPEAESLNIIQSTLNETPKFIMSNSSGFGGANTSLIFRSCQN